MAVLPKAITTPLRPRRTQSVEEATRARESEIARGEAPHTITWHISNPPELELEPLPEPIIEPIAVPTEDSFLEIERLLRVVIPEGDPGLVLEWAERNAEAFAKILRESPEREAAAFLEQQLFEPAVAPVPASATDFETVAPGLQGVSFDIRGQVIHPEETQEAVENVYPGANLETVRQFAVRETEQFINDIQARGRTPEVETLLRSLGLGTEDIEGLFPPLSPEVTLEREQAQAVLGPEPEWRSARTGEVITQSEKEKRFPKGYEPELDEWRLTAETSKNYFHVFKVFGESLTKLPKQLAASILQAVQPTGASAVNKDWADELIADANKDLNEFARKVAERYSGTRLPIKLSDIATLPQSLAFSLTSMGAGLGVGVPIALAPVPGARVAAWAAGTAASGAVAFNMSRYQIMQTYLDVKNEEMKATVGREITIEEEEQLKRDFSLEATKFGLWEAVPEALSNLAFAKLLTLPLGKMVGRNIATKIIAKISGIYGQEFLTETITQKGQSAIEVEAGLREGRITWVEAFKEIAPQTFLLTTILGGLGQVSVSSVNRIKKSLKKEVGDSPLHETILENITEDVFAEVEAEAIATMEGITPPTARAVGDVRAELEPEAEPTAASELAVQEKLLTDLQTEARPPGLEAMRAREEQIRSIQFRIKGLREKATVEAEVPAVAEVALPATRPFEIKLTEKDLVVVEGSAFHGTGGREILNILKTGSIEPFVSRGDKLGESVVSLSRFKKAASDQGIFTIEVKDTGFRDRLEAIDGDVVEGLEVVSDKPIPISDIKSVTISIGTKESLETKELVSGQTLAFIKKQLEDKGIKVIVEKPKPPAVEAVKAPAVKPPAVAEVKPPTVEDKVQKELAIQKTKQDTFVETTETKNISKAGEESLNAQSESAGLPPPNIPPGTIGHIGSGGKNAENNLFDMTNRVIPGEDAGRAALRIWDGTRNRMATETISWWRKGNKTLKDLGIGKTEGR
ncbi:hypothetical protein LCGC14_1496370, partial [marine sediment metagenome]